MLSNADNHRCPHYPQSACLYAAGTVFVDIPNWPLSGSAASPCSDWYFCALDQPVVVACDHTLLSHCYMARVRVEIMEQYPQVYQVHVQNKSWILTEKKNILAWKIRLAFLGWPSKVIEDEAIHRNILGALFLTGIILVALEARSALQSLQRFKSSVSIVLGTQSNCVHFTAMKIMIYYWRTFALYSYLVLQGDSWLASPAGCGAARQVCNYAAVSSSMKLTVVVDSGYSWGNPLWTCGNCGFRCAWFRPLGWIQWQRASNILYILSLSLSLDLWFVYVYVNIYIYI